MTGLIRDIYILTKLELPNSFDRKRIILNFLYLYALSIPCKITGKKKSGTLEDDINDNINIESKIWESFDHIISMYVKYISPKYYMMTYIIKGVATAWHSKSYMEFMKENFTDKHIKIIPEESIKTVEKVARALTDKFEGLDYDTVRLWLLTYQYGLNKFNPDSDKLSQRLANTHIIELGAGIGANVAVHASLSDKGVSVFDIPPMLRLQKQILDRISEDIEMSDISYYSEVEKLIESSKGKKYIVVSYWAFTEFPEGLRKSLDSLIEGAEFSFFACNSEFEGINNLEYMENLTARLKDKKMRSEFIDWNPYKKHSYVLIE